MSLKVGDTVYGNCGGRKCVGRIAHSVGGVASVVYPGQHGNPYRLGMASLTDLELVPKENKQERQLATAAYEAYLEKGAL